MKIPFRDSIFHNDGQRSDKNMPSDLSYLELYMAAHNSKDLTQRQVLELQGLLAEKLKNRRELQKPLIMAD